LTDSLISRPTWNGAKWACEVRLRAWHDLLGVKANDRVEIVFLSEDEEPGDELIAAVRGVIDDQLSLRDAVLSAIQRHYNSVRPKYIAFAQRVPTFMGDPEVSMPENPKPSALAALHTLDGIFVHAVVKDGLAYVGFSFSAAWEPEHGLGVLTHGHRVVEVGGADTSFLEWLAEKDRDASRG
jgi:hypothetical protein